MGEIGDIRDEIVISGLGMSELADSMLKGLTRFDIKKRT